MNATISRKKLARRWTLIILVLFMAVFIIGGTYSRYSNTAVKTASVDLAKWSVKIDGKQMNEISSGELPITLEYVASNHVKTGKLAPAGSANFTLVIDPKDSEVAIDYSISIGAVTGLADSNSAIALTSAKYIVDGADAKDATISEGASDMSFTENLADVLEGKKVTVIGTITWEDKNNTADTKNGLNDLTPKVEVEVTAKQHI